MGLRTNNYTPYFNALVVMKNGTKQVSKKEVKSSSGTIKLGKIVGPCEFSIGIKGFICDAKAKGKHPRPFVDPSFSVRWYMKIDEDGNWTPASAAQVEKLSKHKLSFETGELIPFSKKGEVQLTAKMTSNPALIQKKKKAITMKFTYDFEVVKKEKPKKITSFGFIVGPYITNKRKFTEIDKKVKKPKGVIYPSEFKNKISSILKKFTIEEVKVLGHADSRGTELHNLGVGFDRAMDFAKFLQAIDGFDRKNTFVDPKTKGEAPGNTKDEDNPSQRVVVIKISATAN